jgi:hypothetical protein
VTTSEELARLLVAMAARLERHGFSDAFEPVLNRRVADNGTLWLFRLLEAGFDPDSVAALLEAQSRLSAETQKRAAIAIRACRVMFGAPAGGARQVAAELGVPWPMIVPWPLEPNSFDLA